MLGKIINIFSKKDNRLLIEALKEGALLVDVRSFSEFSTGSLDGAVNVPLAKLTSQLALFKDRGCVIVFCMSGYRSMQAKGILEQHGMQNIIDGGTFAKISKLMPSKE